MVELKKIDMENGASEDVLFKSVIKISKEIDEDIDSSTFITAQDTITSNASLWAIKNPIENSSEILRDFVFN